MSNSPDRRAFLKTSLFAALGLLAPNRAKAGPTPEKSWGCLNLYNIHTGEKVSAAYRETDGRYDNRAINELTRLLRCHHTDEQHAIDPQTLDFLDQVNARLGGGHEIHIISGYRSPRYNEYLINLGHKVARKSLHLEGRALDVRIPGVPLTELRNIAMSLRLGGVGFYPGDNFVHLDSGAFRFW